MVKKKFSSPYGPSMNGLFESTNRKLMEIIVKYMEENTKIEWMSDKCYIKLQYKTLNIIGGKPFWINL